MNGFDWRAFMAIVAGHQVTAVSGRSPISRKSFDGRLLRLGIMVLLSIAAPVAGLVAPSARAAERGEIDKADYFKPELAPVRQSGPYDVTIVYFMDYQCPACRKYTPDVTRALNEDPRVRVIYRDTPIFGPRSEEAARVAIASQFQGKHEAMHLALMQSPMPLDEQAIKAAAKKAGVDWDRLQRDLKARGSEIDQQIAWNMELSTGAGIAGTPAFIIGDTLANGVLDYAGLKASIADARREAKPGAGASAAASPQSQKPPPTQPAAQEAAADAAPKSGGKAAVPAAKTVQFEPSPADAEPARQAPPEAGSGRYLWPAVAGLAALLAAAALIVRRRRA